MSSVKGQRWSDPKGCGTGAAYRRHYRHGEKPCLACRLWRSRDWQDQRAARETQAILGDLETMLAIAEGSEDGSLAEDDDGTWYRRSPGMPVPAERLSSGVSNE